ncbi:MAG: class I SAM-dependent methyltransferase, partial [Candidatus Eiseniibacteriota bacterium]
RGAGGRMTAGEPIPAACVTLDRCLACGGRRLRPLALAYLHHGQRFPLVECRTCGMRFLGVQPSPQALAGFYDAAYFEREFRCGRTNASSFDAQAFRVETGGLLDAFAALGASGRLLDVGCAGGLLLKHAAERGWQAQGVEIAPDAVAHARAEGLDVFAGDLLEARFPADHFDLVYMGDVLEHAHDCRAVVDEAARILKPGGLFYLRGPITTHSLARSLALGACRALGRTLVLREVPYHLWEFRPGPLRRLIEVAGLRVERVRQSKIPPGGARGRKSALERAIMAAIDLVNLPLTAIFNAQGDRIVVVARKPAPIRGATAARPST